MRETIEAAGIAVVVGPFATSIGMTLWDEFWNGYAKGALPQRFHRLLLATQLLLVAWLLSGLQVQYALAAGALMFVALASGGTFVLANKGSVPCGCWGRSESTIGVPLIAGNLVAASIAGAGALASSGSTFWLAGSLVAIVSVLVSVAGALLLPEALHTYRGLADRAAPYSDWARGFPSLKKGA